MYREKFDASPYETHSAGNAPHIDHIYPRAKLNPLGLRGDEVNHLGNFRFVGAKDNIRKRAASHFSRIKIAGVPVEKYLLEEPWASDPARLTLDVAAYTAFRDARFTAILNIAKKIVNPEV